MIIKSSDIVRRQGTILIPTLGSVTITGFGKVSMHEPTGVVFIEQFVDGNFDKFIVGAFSAQSIITEEKEFTENTEQNFFNAVKYFEELIQKLSPPEPQELPSVGKFYFFKESLNVDCYVEIPGMPRITIQRMDVPLVFTPPQTKLYGRLNMTDIPKPEYEAISSKFALKYNENDSKEVEGYQQGLFTLSDFAVYDMTPYQNSETPQGESEDTPEDINDEQLSPDDIEGEDMNDKQNKEDQKKGEDEGEGGEGTEEDEGEEEGEGEGEGEPSEEQSAGGQGEGQGVEDFELTRDQARRQQVDESQLIPLLENTFEAKEGLKDKFRKQNFLISSISGYSNQELKQLFYDKLNLPANYTKAEFIKLITDNTKNIF